MRLIDIEDEALLKTVSLGHMSMKALWKRLKNEPTVEAIPIDFLIKTQEEYCKRYGGVYKAVVLNLVEDWRKENDTN